MAGGGNGFDKRCECAHVYNSTENNCSVYHGYGIFPFRAKAYYPYHYEVSKIFIAVLLVSLFQVVLQLVLRT